MEFVELLRANNVRYDTEGRYSRPGWVAFACPWCRGGSNPDKLYAGFNTANGVVTCWRCGTHRLGETIALITGKPLPAAIGLAREIPRRAGVGPVARGTLELPRAVGAMGPPHTTYLTQRGFDPVELHRLWGLQGIGLANRLSWRIFIPIHFRGDVVSWTTRSIHPTADCRYIAARPEQEAIPRQQILYGWDYVRHTCVIHEGPADVWNTGPGSVATLGNALSPGQIELISRCLVRVFCFDTEPAAQARARRYADMLAVMPGETYNVVLDAKDPGSATKEEIAKLRAEFLE